MKNKLPIFVIVFVLIAITIYFIFFQFGDSSRRLRGIIDDAVGVTGGESDTGRNENGNSAQVDSSKASAGGSGGGAGGGGGSGGSAGGNGGGSGGVGGAGGGVDTDGTGNTTLSNELLCLSARPGNLPDISCEVNFIKSDSVSLRMINNIGQDIFVNLVLSGCSNQASGNVQNNGYSDFILFCNAQGFFEEDLTITYTIGENSVQVVGIVSGHVS